MRHSDSRKLFCHDNRRLFMIKVLGCQLSTAPEMTWMKEFDDKLRH
jgi:hypothetical protein